MKWKKNGMGMECKLKRNGNELIKTLKKEKIKKRKSC